MARVGSAGHLTIGDGAFVGVRAGLHKDVAPGTRVWGTPQMEERTWHRAMAALARLPDALRRLRALEQRLGVRKGHTGTSGGEDA
jgi:UDP-3-O-[3-hydroxymyristoyl] glucosamine N-acyltransferase